jgi:hypothetical protein
MNAELSILNKFRYRQSEWLYAKISLILLWLYPVINILFKFNSQPIPVGVCCWFNCAFATITPFCYILSATTVILSVLYLFERKMLIVTFLISMLGMLVFSLEASNGLSGRKEAVSMLFIVQFLAYLRYSLGNKEFKEATTPKDIAMFYSVQVVATAFVLAGITKLQESGIAWVRDAPNIAVRIVRSFSMRTIDTGYLFLSNYGRYMAQGILAHPAIIQAGFAIVLIAELFSFCAVFSRRWAWRCGLVLVFINLGFLVLLGIIIPFYFVPILGYLISFGPGRKTASGPSFSIKTFPLKSLAVMFTIPIVYMALTLLIGDQHPFSKVSLFASSSNRTAYYYLKDQDNLLLHGNVRAIYRTGEIKSIITQISGKKGIEVDDPEGIKTIAPEIFSQLLRTKRSEEKWSSVTRLKLYMHEIKLLKGNLEERDILLGEASLKRKGV